MTAIIDQYGNPFPAPSRNGHATLPLYRQLARPAGREVRALYDSAQTSEASQYYWAGSDASDSDRANAQGPRKAIRERARQVVANDPLAKGIVLTLANHEIGPQGPTLQVIGGVADKRSKVIEQRWGEWCDEVGFVSKLYTLTQARIVDGEGFGWKRENPGLENPVQLDWFLFEADLCYTPWIPYLTPNRCDGVWYDDFGRPTFYDILRFHPGGVYPMPSLLYDTYPAQLFTHLFRRERPNQHRGISELSPALTLFAQRKMYLNAVIRAAQNAAKFSVLLHTQGPANGDVQDASTIGAAELPDGLVAALPFGYDATAFKPEQPATTLEMFERIMVGRIARAMNMPYNIAACDSSSYNFASGRLDHQTYFASIKVSQQHTGRTVCDPLFADWFRRANAAYRWGYPADFVPPHVWHWTEPEYSDPEAEANALKTALAIGATNHAAILTRKGLEVEAVFTKAAEALGFKTVDEYRAWLRDNIAGKQAGGGGFGQAQPGAKQAGEPPTPEGAE